MRHYDRKTKVESILNIKTKNTDDYLVMFNNGRFDYIVQHPKTKLIKGVFIREYELKSLSKKNKKVNISDLPSDVEEIIDAECKKEDGC